MIRTTHLLKKCSVRTHSTDSNPFKRGALTFEDFNYSGHNPYILLKRSNSVSAVRDKESQNILGELE